MCSLCGAHYKEELKSPQTTKPPILFGCQALEVYTRIIKHCSPPMVRTACLSVCVLGAWRCPLLYGWLVVRTFYLQYILILILHNYDYSCYYYCSICTRKFGNYYCRWHFKIIRFDLLFMQTIYLLFTFDEVGILRMAYTICWCRMGYQLYHQSLYVIISIHICVV